MIVVDSSAVVAVLLGEPLAERIMAVLASDADKLISAATYVEAGTVLAARRRKRPHQAIAEFDSFLADMDIRLSTVDAEQARIALKARVRFGRGMGHGGLLNYGDSFSYALAMVENAPLLFIGNDFGQTDVQVAL